MDRLYTDARDSSDLFTSFHARTYHLPISPISRGKLVNDLAHILKRDFHIEDHEHAAYELVAAWERDAYNNGVCNQDTPYGVIIVKYVHGTYIYDMERE